MKLGEIQDKIDLLAAQISLILDYQSYDNNFDNLLIVEGSTDRDFLKQSSYLKNNVKCIIANNAFGFKNSLSLQDSPKDNNKNAIIYVVYGLSRIPTLIKIPNGLKRYSIYGMVDMDFNIPNQYVQTNSLFITDTHDLETLMLSTDLDLLGKLDKCQISTNDIRLAFFMAYELGKVKSLLSEKYFPSSPLSSGVNYNLFFNRDNLISLPNVLHLINNIRKRFSSKDLNKIIDELCKKGKRFFDKNGLWKTQFSNFNLSKKPDDFWTTVNGHDILNLLRYIRPDLSSVLPSFSGTGLNRAFEIKLIEKYNFKAFKTTNLYKKMKKEKIVI